MINKMIISPEELRAHLPDDKDIWYSQDNLLSQAADEIERQQKEIEALKNKYNYEHVQHVGTMGQYKVLIEERDHLKTLVNNFEREYEIADKTLQNIDWHLREMQNDNKISMKDMVEALKVISDGIKESKDRPGPYERHIQKQIYKITEKWITRCQALFRTLEFYAEPGNWKDSKIHEKDSSEVTITYEITGKSGKRTSFTNEEMRGGKQARAAVKTFLEDMNGKNS